MRTLIASLVILIIVGFVGCSGGVDTPAIPDTADKATPNRSTAHQLWGLWEFAIDPVNEEVSFVQVRSGELHLNALHFLEPPPYLNLTIEGPPEFSGGIVTVDIGLRHPFLGLAQFTGFDVKGILIGHGSEVIYDWSFRYAGENDLRLLNADGYTRWWNPTEFPPNPLQPIKGYKDGLLGTSDSMADFSATLNGYKYFCDDLHDPDSPLDTIDVTSRGVFSAGQKNVRRYVIDYTPSGLIFNYAIDASWKFPTGSSPWKVPDDFPPEANQPEPYRISVHEIENTLAYEESTGVASGTLKLEIDVYNWFEAENVFIIGLPAKGELVTSPSSLPIGGGVGYSTYEIEAIPSDNMDSNDDILLWIDTNCLSPMGYGGILPGDAQATYFPYWVDVEEFTGDECGDKVHEYEADFPITGVDLDGNVFLGDIGLQEVGPHAGKAVMQTKTSEFSAVEITSGQIGNAVVYFTYSENNYHHSIDCCPFSGRIALADPGNSNNDEVDIFDVDGNKLTTYITGGANVICLDFDDNGDMWVVTKSGTTPVLRHFLYEPDDPYYTPGDTLTLTSQFPTSSGDWLFGDIAIDYKDNMAFIMACTSGGFGVHYLAAYDISGPPLFISGRDDVFTGPVAATCHSHVKYGRRLDIEIDHSLAEYCHIVASAQIRDGNLYRHQLVKLDYELATMDVYTGEAASAYQNLPSQIIVSPDSPHDLIATPQNLGKVQLFSCDDW